MARVLTASSAKMPFNFCSRLSLSVACAIATRKINERVYVHNDDDDDDENYALCSHFTSLLYAELPTIALCLMHSLII